MAEGQTNYNHPAADECLAISNLLFRTAGILHDLKADRTPLRGYGLDKPSQFKAAAKVLRLLSADLGLRADKLKNGELK